MSHFKHTEIMDAEEKLEYTKKTLQNCLDYYHNELNEFVKDSPNRKENEIGYGWGWIDAYEQFHYHMKCILKKIS